MPLEKQSPAILRFGVFEVDVRAGELRKQGVRIKLQEQPFHVLIALLQRPGTVVTREELRSQLWQSDTFVDFDNGLNTCMNKLREALGDSADNPRFIETVPRRGYRFFAPISADGLKKPAIIAHGRRVALLAAVVVLLVAAVIAGWLWRSRRARVLTEKDTIVLGDFANSTGDPVFDGTLREGLSVQLEQSPFLSLVSEEGLHQTLRMMGQPAKARLTPEITREICQRTNSTAALDGSIALIGTRYNLILKAVNCANGDLLASTEAQANDTSHVLDALSKASSDLRSKLGESLSTVEKYNTPLAQATTPSLEALQAYSLGFKADAAGDESAALMFFERATQIDPNFAMAYLGMAGAYGIMGESVLAIENSWKAFALRDRVSALEKLIIEEEHAFYGSGDLTKALQICEFGARTYPRVSIFHEDLAGGLGFIGQYESGLRENLEALRLAPYRGILYRARTLADGMSKTFPEDTIVQFNYLPTLRAKLALLEGHPQEAVHSLEAAAPDELGLAALGLYNWPNLYPVYVRGEAYLAARKGREAAAEFQKTLDHRGIVLNEPIGALDHLQLGRAYALQGDTAKARGAYQDFLALWKDADPDIPILIAAKSEYAKLH